jgi:hypothetical protein
MILVIAKARNQMDDVDLEDETIDAEILNPKAILYDHFKSALMISNTLAILKKTSHLIHSFRLIMKYACTYYSPSQPKTIVKYFWTYGINFGSIVYIRLFL